MVQGKVERAGRPASTAYINPWCAVPLVGGACVLFGFAVWHPNTGGLSWVCSTPIRMLDAGPVRRLPRAGAATALAAISSPKAFPARASPPPVHLKSAFLTTTSAAAGSPAPPIITANWQATGAKWTLPVGVQDGRLIKLGTAECLCRHPGAL
jgi:hypothetical protein